MPANRLHYAWVIFGLTFLTLLVAAGVRATPGVLIVPLEAEFGWSRTTISFAVAVNIFLYGLTGPFAAALMERIGLRRVMIGALVVIAFGVLLTPWMTASWQLVLLWGVAVGLGSGVTAVVLGATIAARWFTKRRGLVMGVLTASTATGQLIFLPLLASLVENHGWRAVSFTMAGICAALTLPVALLMRDRPYDLGLAPFGDSDPPTPPPRITENPALRALRILRHGLGSRDFWLLSGSFFVCGASTNGLIGTHLIAACVDSGIPEVAGAGLLASMGVFDFFGTSFSGWLSDRFDGRKLLAWYYGLRGLSLLFLPFALHQGVWALGVFAVFYGLDWIATVPPTLRLTAGVFGEQVAPVYFGWIVATHQVGAAMAAWAAGALRVGFGDYVAAFTGAGALCLIAAAMVLMIGAPGGGVLRQRRLDPAVQA